MFDDPQFAQKIVELGQDPAPTTPAGLTAHMRNETARWAKVIKEAGLKPER
jgi:tripartite-type tricarboxylate transporter receptor subunit TctC